MPTKFIAVEGCTLAHKSGSQVSGGVFTITSVASLKVKCESKGVYKTDLQYTFAGGNFSGMVAGSVATTSPQTISATSIKCKADGSFVMRVEDFGTMTAQGVLNPPPPGVTAPAVGLVEISDAGQVKVKSN